MTLLILLACAPPRFEDASIEPASVPSEDARTSDPALKAPGDLVHPQDPLGPFTLYAVRHAEKDVGSDPGLTEEGQARAQALAERMRGVPLAAIYATTYLRTQETVRPTAEDHGLPVLTHVEPDEALAAWIREEHVGQELLHAGHTDTLPQLMAALGVRDERFSVDGYGQLWVLRVDAMGGVHLTEERYGD